MVTFLLTDLFAADGGNKNGDGGKLAGVAGNIAGDAGKRKQRHVMRRISFRFREEPAFPEERFRL